MSRGLDEERLQVDLAKLDLALAEARSAFHDEQINLFDVCAIRKAAQHFGVTPKAAYYRAYSLGVLSYQSDELPGPALSRDLPADLTAMTEEGRS